MVRDFENILVLGASTVDFSEIRFSSSTLWAIFSSFFATFRFAISFLGFATLFAALRAFSRLFSILVFFPASLFSLSTATGFLVSLFSSSHFSFSFLFLSFPKTFIRNTHFNLLYIYSSKIFHVLLRSIIKFLWFKISKTFRFFASIFTTFGKLRLARLTSFSFSENPISTLPFIFKFLIASFISFVFTSFIARLSTKISSLSCTFQLKATAKASRPIFFGTSFLKFRSLVGPNDDCLPFSKSEFGLIRLAPVLFLFAARAFFRIRPVRRDLWYEPEPAADSRIGKHKPDGEARHFFSRQKLFQIIQYLSSFLLSGCKRETLSFNYLSSFRFQQSFLHSRHCASQKQNIIFFVNFHYFKISDAGTSFRPFFPPFFFL